MKQKALALAIRHIMWAGFGLSAAVAVPAFAQSQPAAPASGATAAAPAAAASGAAATPATRTNGSNTAKLKTFEVTGSLIRQADKTGFQQVQVITSKDIQQSGQTTVSDYLRSISANSANSWSQSTNNNFSAGGSGIALRGLSEKYTLVLIDGQRVAPYGFPSNSTDSFFDLNTLPLNTIDRIEVVKTGAVSQYGSDAIAGVVNIITKHDYQGLQLDGSLGGSTDGGDGNLKFGVLGGFGNLTSDGYNFTATASYEKDNGFTAADRGGNYAAQDWTGAYNGLNIGGPSYIVSPAGVAQPFGSTCRGGSQIPYGNNTTSLYGLAPGGGNICSLNPAEAVSYDPMITRLNAKIHGDFKINDNTTAFVDLWESNNTTTQNNGYVGNLSSGAIPSNGSVLLYNPKTNQLTPFVPMLSATNPSNPFGVASPLVYSWPYVASDTTSANFWRASAGVKGQFTMPHAGDWDWSLSASHSQSTVSNTYTGGVNANALQNLLNSSYDFSSEAIPPGLFENYNNIAISKLDTVDATMSTPNLFHLPTGDVGFGLGAQFLHESESLTQGGNTIDGELVNPALQTVIGERNVAAVYYQFDIPIVKNLTFSQSGRYDHYSDFGGVFSPRYALRFQPIQQFTTYASFNRGFRAPSFVENTPSTTLGTMAFGQNNQEITVVTAGNPNLQPERTKNYNVGFELSPARGTDVGFDWYKIHIDNAIGVNQADPQIVYNPNGTIAYGVLPYQNIGSVDTSGLETTFSQAIHAGRWGTFTFAGDWAYILQFKMGLPSGSFDGAGNDLTMLQPFGGSFPRWKGNTSLSWAYNKWLTTLTWQYVGPYAEALQGTSVGSYSQFNLNFQYTGFKHWTIYGGIDNLFDKAPPYDPEFQGYFGNTAYDPSLYNYIGRFLQIGATYKF